MSIKTKKQLIDDFCNTYGTTRNEAKTSLSRWEELFTAEIMSGNEIRLKGIGTTKTIWTQERVHRLPNGKLVTEPAKWVPKTYFSDSFKKEVANNIESPDKY